MALPKTLQLPVADRANDDVEHAIRRLVNVDLKLAIRDRFHSESQSEADVR